MKKIKEINGITLVALIITIIILLILAGITIAQLSNSGLFDKTKVAKEKYENAQDDENDKIAQYTNEVDNYINGYRNFSSVNYSTSEQDTGLKWIDGKPIYQKTINVGTLPNNSTKSINHGISNLKQVCALTGIGARTVNGKTQYITLSLANADASWNVMLSVLGENIEITTWANWGASIDSFVTIQYTKTTD